MCRFARLFGLRSDREGGTKVEGKIESGGTPRGFRPGLHVGWCGTRQRGYGAFDVRKALRDNGLARVSYDPILSGWRHGRP